MDLIRYSIERPIAIFAAVALIMLFGWLALLSIPIQLSPSIAQPAIHIWTAWPGAAPAEVEREIVNPQEEALRGLTGLESLISTSQEGAGNVRLGFPVGHDMEKALLLVANRLDRVTDYPEEARAPSFRAEEPRGSYIAWLYLRTAEGNARPIGDYGDFARDVIRERLERVPGIRHIAIGGGRNREIRIAFDPARLVRYGFTISELLDRLRSARVAITAGDIIEGKRRYVVRAEWQLNTIENINRIVLRSATDAAGGGIGRVTVADVADVAFHYRQKESIVRMNGRPAIDIGIQNQTDTNVIETMREVREAIAELQSGPVAREGLVLEQKYGETGYIDSAIDLVLRNIWLGGTVAVVILLLFLRSARATVIVALAIPTSVVASFVAMAASGGSINVLSLAGIAFAVGMVVDAAIIVLENIYRLRQQGESARQAALHGTHQVWGAILISSLTTVLVFIPLLLMDLAVGKLFRDIAVAITVAVSMSLLVSVTVIPALASRMLTGDSPPKKRNVFIIDDLARAFVAGTIRSTRIIVNSRRRAIAVATAITASWWLMPPLEYLPEGDRNLIIGVAAPSSGYNFETAQLLGDRIEKKLLPLLATKTARAPLSHDAPAADYVALNIQRDRIRVMARSVEPDRAGNLKFLIRDAMLGIPDVTAYSYRPSLFPNVDGGRTIRLTVSGTEFETIFNVIERARNHVSEILPQSGGTNTTTTPRLVFGAPEIRVRPDAARLADNGISARELGLTIDAYNDGIRVDEIYVDGRLMNLTLAGQTAELPRTQGIGDLPIITRNGSIVPVSLLATVGLTAGPTAIRHEEGLRAAVLRIGPPPEIAMETALDLLRGKVVDRLRADGLPDDIQLRLGGVADALTAAAAEIRLDLVFAFVIVFLVMAVLFENFIYPLIIVLSVPVAVAGGFVGFTILNLYSFQPMDMLTLLGFVILVGIVVNNAILLVHQTLHHVRVDKMPPTEAVVEATGNRIRPIFMSTLTSIGGMLPLVLFSGAGSELYRGLGSVVVGGLSLSAVLTLAIVPPLLIVVVGTLERRGFR
ncbi:MAG: efflux RND transporter permease subunit [Alphaproteobacteria bacterium]